MNSGAKAHCLAAWGRISARGGLLLAGMLALSFAGRMPAAPDYPSVLTNVAWVRTLLRDATQTNERPSLFRATVNSLDPDGRRLVVQDGTNGVSLSVPAEQRLPGLGELVEIDSPVRFQPGNPDIELTPTRVQPLGILRELVPEKPDYDSIYRGALNRRYLEIEGTVLQANASGRRLMLHLGDAQGWIIGQVYSWPESGLGSNWFGARIRLRGTSLGGGPTALRSSSQEEITFLRPGTSDIFAAPLTNAAALIARRLDPGDRYRLLATVLNVRSNALTLAEGGVSFEADYLYPLAGSNSGPARFVGPAIPRLGRGDRVELVGSPKVRGPNLTMRFSALRKIGSAGDDSAGAGLPTLTNARQVVELGKEGARLNPHPVRLRGVVTLLAKGYRNWIYVQDETAGVLVVHQELPAPLREGQWVEVEGLADSGAFHAFVNNARITVLGEAAMPLPKRTPVDRLRAGADFGQWVRVRAGVRNLARLSSGTALLGSSGNHLFITWINAPLEELPADWADAEVEIDGVVWTSTDAQDRPVGFRLHTPGTNFIRVLRPGSSNLFGKPLTQARQLRSRPHPGDARVLVRGVVTAASPNASWIVLHDGTGPINIQVLPNLRGTYLAGLGTPRDPRFLELNPPATGPLPRPGDLVEAVGVPWTDELLGPRLGAGQYRVIGQAPQPEPKTIRANEGLLPANDLELVRIKARFLDRSASNATVQLWLQSEEQIFEALIPGEATAQLNLQGDHLLEVTGVCTPVLGELGKPRGLRLLLRDARDVRQLHTVLPILSTGAQRALLGAAGVSVAALAWVWLLRRQVRQRTAQLQQEVDDRKRAEASIVASEAQRRASEERFRNAFHASPALMALTRYRDARFVAVNEAFLKASGYLESEILGQSAEELNLYARPEQRLEFRELLKTHGVVRDREHTMLTKDGSLRTLLVSGEMTMLDGEPHTLTVALDITARKQAEQDTLRALAAEKELGELKSRFVSMVSHEFRTPLGIVMSAVELLRHHLERLPAGKREELFEDIHKSTRHMAGLMEQVLVLGRVEAGKLVFRPSLVDLAALCHKLVDESISATSRLCPIQLEVAPELPAAEVDESLLRHILSNLLSNAVKYSPDRQPVRLQLERQGTDAVFRVADRGLGIPMEDRAKLFQAFHRGSNVGEVPGTGLGLLIVKRCVDLHNGTIELDSQPGQGTTFTVRLPIFRP